MSDQQEVQRQTALRLRDMASGFLGSAAGIDDPELRRKLTRWAFELVQEAVALEPIRRSGRVRLIEPIRGIKSCCTCKESQDAITG